MARITMKKFIKGIDFDMLKKQKRDLNETIEYLERQGMDKKAESLQGIRNLIDKVQDVAVDKYKYDEDRVFDLEE